MKNNINKYFNVDVDLEKIYKRSIWLQVLFAFIHWNDIAPINKKIVEISELTVKDTNILLELYSRYDNEISYVSNITKNYTFNDFKIFELFFYLKSHAGTIISGMTNMIYYKTNFMTFYISKTGSKILIYDETYKNESKKINKLQTYIQTLEKKLSGLPQLKTSVTGENKERLKKIYEKSLNDKDIRNWKDIIALNYMGDMIKEKLQAENDNGKKIDSVDMLETFLKNNGFIDKMVNNVIGKIRKMKTSDFNQKYYSNETNSFSVTLLQNNDKIGEKFLKMLGKMSLYEIYTEDNIDFSTLQEKNNDYSELMLTQNEHTETVNNLEKHFATVENSFFNFLTTYFKNLKYENGNYYDGQTNLTPFLNFCVFMEEQITKNLDKINEYKYNNQITRIFEADCSPSKMVLMHLVTGQDKKLPMVKETLELVEGLWDSTQLKIHDV